MRCEQGLIQNNTPDSNTQYGLKGSFGDGVMVTKNIVSQSTKARYQLIPWQPDRGYRFNDNIVYQSALQDGLNWSIEGAAEAVNNRNLDPQFEPTQATDNVPPLNWLRFKIVRLPSMNME